MAILIKKTITLIITKERDIIANTKVKAIKRGFSNKRRYWQDRAGIKEI